MSKLFNPLLTVKSNARLMRYYYANKSELKNKYFAWRRSINNNSDLIDILFKQMEKDRDRTLAKLDKMACDYEITAETINRTHTADTPSQHFLNFIKDDDFYIVKIKDKLLYISTNGKVRYELFKITTTGKKLNFFEAEKAELPDKSVESAPENASGVIKEEAMGTDTGYNVSEIPDVMEAKNDENNSDC